MKFAQFILMTTLVGGIALTSSVTFANNTATTPVIKENVICPNWPDCKPVPNEEKPPRK